MVNVETIQRWASSPLGASVTPVPKNRVEFQNNDGQGMATKKVYYWTTENKNSTLEARDNRAHAKEAPKPSLDFFMI